MTPSILLEALHSTTRRNPRDHTLAQGAKCNCSPGSGCRGLADVRAPFVNVHVGERGRSQVHFGSED